MRKIITALCAVAASVMLCVPAFAGQWVKNDSVYRDQDWWYRNDDGSYPHNQWQKIDGSWSYFDENGWLLTSQWIQGTYYVGKDGAMMHDTQTLDGYYVGSDGKYIAGSDTLINGEYFFTSARQTWYGLSSHGYYGPFSGAQLTVSRISQNAVRVFFHYGMEQGQTIIYHNYGYGDYFDDTAGTLSFFYFENGNLIMCPEDGDAESDYYQYIYSK